MDWEVDSILEWVEVLKPNGRSKQEGNYQLWGSFSQVWQLCILDALVDSRVEDGEEMRVV